MKIYRATRIETGAGADHAAPAPDAMVVGDGRILALGQAESLAQRYPTARPRNLGRAIILPGFVNAHQHGRGLSQIQLGLPDDALEPWIARRCGWPAPDIYGLTRLAAEQMIRNGVTATLHANYSYGTGDYETELRETIRAYRDSGIRATICLGYADRGALIYPPGDEGAFRAALPPGAQALLAGARPAYLPLPETLALMARLLDECADTPRITLAYGPAAPQWVSDAAWRDIAADAAHRGLGIHFHLLESAAQARALDQLYPAGVMAHLRGLGVFEAPVSIAHFTHASAPEIKAARQSGVTIVANPGANMRLCNGPPPLAHWRAAGLDIAVGTDNCALDDNEDYLSELRLAGLLCRGPDCPALPADALLAMGTRQGTKAAFLPGTGTLAPGQPADFTALSLGPARSPWSDPDCDALALILARATGEHVIRTVIGGETLYGPQANRADYRLSMPAPPGPKARAAAEALAQAVRAHYRPLRSGG